MGGVGGTVTILCYGYWIQEEGRTGAKDLKVCRLDLAAAYVVTALFGLAMVIIGSQVEVRGGGATLLIRLAERLTDSLGPLGGWAFLLGAWGAIFSSLLGAWQSIPYLFTDLTSLMGVKGSGKRRRVDCDSRFYRGYMYAMATVPMVGLWVGFALMQKTYAIVGVLFVPMLAAALLRMNGKAGWDRQPLPEPALDLGSAGLHPPIFPAGRISGRRRGAPAITGDPASNAVTTFATGC